MYAQLSGVAASILSPIRSRGTAWAAASVTVIAAAVFTCPIFGIPLALGVTAYGVIKFSKPHTIVRGRILSRRQHQRAAVTVGAGILAVAALFSAGIRAVELANLLEARLCDRLEVSHRKGELAIEQTLQECEQLACARATIVQLATHSALGIAKLSGFVMHDQSLYGW